MPTPPPVNGRSTPPEFDRFADVVMQFAEATESLLGTEMSHPFNFGSEAMRDVAAHSEYPGTDSKQTLQTLALQQVAAGFEQCNLLRGVAAVLRADRVVSAPFPLSRTSAVIAAKAFYVLTADSREERLRRYLNEELAALYDSPMPSNDKNAMATRAGRTADYLAVGEKAKLTPVYPEKPRIWNAPHLIRPGHADSKAPPPSETQLMRDLYRASGVEEDDLAGLPYSLLSAAAHGRFHHVGLVGYAAAGPSVGGISNAAMHATLPVTAQSTMYAAVATRTYLSTLARYTSVPEEVVQQRLQRPTADWLATGQPSSAT